MGNLKKLKDTFKKIINFIIKLLIKTPKYILTISPFEYKKIFKKNFQKLKNIIKFEERHFIKNSIKDTEDAYQQEKKEHSEIAKKCKFGIIEIGILNGETSKIFAEANSSIRIYGIDPLIPDSMLETLIGNEEMIKKNTRNLNNFHFIKDYSYNVVKNWDKPFDYLFIDGSHLYEDVKKDFEDWFPLLKKNGIISFHDSTMNRGGLNYWEDPSRFADELIFDKRVEFIKSIARLTVFKKL